MSFFRLCSLLFITNFSISLSASDSKPLYQLNQAHNLLKTALILVEDTRLFVADDTRGKTVFRQRTPSMEEELTEIRDFIKEADDVHEDVLIANLEKEATRLQLQAAALREKRTKRQSEDQKYDQ